MTEFHRMSGCGNQFAIFDGRAHAIRLRPADVIRIAQIGQGVDQVIVIESDQSDAADPDHPLVRIWNRDGSEVESCGNAMRCVGWLLTRQSHRDEAVFSTRGGIVRTWNQGDMTIAVDMGVPQTHWQDIPLAEQMDSRRMDFSHDAGSGHILSDPGAVNMGNPHVVFFVDDVDAIDIAAVGPVIETHRMFPHRVNVGLAQILSPERICLRVWERGAGLTKACGTGACAAVVAAHRRGNSGRTVTVITDGGELLIDWRASDGHVIMIGEVTLHAPGSIDLLQETDA